MADLSSRAFTLSNPRNLQSLQARKISQPGGKTSKTHLMYSYNTRMLSHRDESLAERQRAENPSVTKNRGKSDTRLVWKNGRLQFREIFEIPMNRKIRIWTSKYQPLSWCIIWAALPVLPLQNGNLLLLPSFTA